jgi:geranylgeranyl pyrophosphate synthase
VLACEAAGGRARDADPVAVGVELLHTFSLVHDDVMDEDATRRGVPSVHEAYDAPGAVLVGDALYALAFEVLGDLPADATAATIAADLARTARRLCEGQHRDMAFEDTWPSLDAYEAMVDKKTAELFASATRNGGRVAGADEATVRALDRAGRRLGAAFQVRDDVLDLAGDEDELGKPVGSDLEAGKKTYPVLVARDRADPAEADRFEAVLDGDADEDELAWAAQLVVDTGALDAAGERTRALLGRAREALEQLDASPARATLLDVADAVADRQA